jgi:hypothetical protein
VQQISRGKLDCFRYATAGFTTSVLEGYGDFAITGPLVRRPRPPIRFLSIGPFVAPSFLQSRGNALALRGVQQKGPLIAQRPGDTHNIVFAL